MTRVALAARTGLFALIMIFSVQAQAQTVFTTVEATIDGVFSSDPKGPVNANITSALDFPAAANLDFSDNGKGQASLRPDGSGAVYVETLWANGSAQNTVTARGVWTQSATNNTGAPVPYDFEFLITPGNLWIGDFAGLEDTDPRRPVVSFDLVIRANGSPVFQSSAILLGGFVSHQLIESGTSLNPSFVDNGTRFGYEFQSYTDVIDLGMVDPGASITVEYEMTAEVDTPGFEAGGRAQIGDPFDLDANPGFEGDLRVNGAVAAEGSSWGQVKSLFR